MENTDKEVKKAKKVLEEISQDEYERYLTELRQKYIMDQKAIEDAGYDKRLRKRNKWFSETNEKGRTWYRTNWKNN